jgi:hypothetical protein
MYAVVKGQKVFTLLPPSDAYRLDVKKVRVARYQRKPDGSWDLKPEDTGRVGSIGHTRRFERGGMSMLSQQFEAFFALAMLLMRWKFEAFLQSAGGAVEFSGP